MTRGEAVNWLISIMSDIGKIEHQDLWHYEQALSEIRELLEAQPERKKGEWRHYEGYLTCSECGTEYDDDIMTHCGDDVPKFCPNCGAMMEGDNG